MLTRVYFTFGSWEEYPHHDTYMIVEAESMDAAIVEYRKKYPNLYENCLNCSNYYTEKEWNERISQFYIGIQPAEILQTEIVKEMFRMKTLFTSAVEMILAGVCEGITEKSKLLEMMGTTEEELSELGIVLDEQTFV